MCVLSVVIDQYRDHWDYRTDKFVSPIPPYQWPFPEIVNEGEREKLKKELEEFRRILKKAKEWDAAHPTEPCEETPQKIEALREVVRALGLEEEVDIVLKEVLENDVSTDVQPHTTISTDSTYAVPAWSSSESLGLTVRGNDSITT